MSNPTPRSPLRRLATAALAALATGALLPIAVADSATADTAPVTYFISPSGNDSNAGTSPAQAFRNVTKIEKIVLKPGDKVLLERGATFTGKLGIWRDGTAAERITVSSYGDRRAPKPVVTNDLDWCVMVGASYVTIQDIHVSRCRSGIWARGTQNLVTRVEATHNIHGIEIAETSSRSRVVRNYVHHNDQMFPDTPGEFDDSGATGILIVGDDTEVAYNRITDNIAPSEDFGTDGSAVEIYGARGTVVHHNVSRNNRTFTELGNSRSANTTFAYNVATSNLVESEFLITRGGDDYFGPVTGTVAVNNTVRLTGAKSRGFVCYAGCTPQLFAMYNNIFDVAGLVGHIDGARAGGNNIYWRGDMWSVDLLPGDRVTDPKFAGARLRLKSGSPAIDKGRGKHSKRDLGGRKVGVDGNADGKAGTDIGAFEAKKKKAKKKTVKKNKKANKNKKNKSKKNKNRNGGKKRR